MAKQTNRGGASAPASQQQPPSQTEEKLTVTLRHKTPNQVYRRAGVVLTKGAKQYEVTAEQFEVLIDDAWVEVVEGDAQEGAEK